TRLIHRGMQPPLTWDAGITASHLKGYFLDGIMTEVSASPLDPAEQECFQHVLSSQGVLLGAHEQALNNLADVFQDLFSDLQEKGLCTLTDPVQSAPTPTASAPPPPPEHDPRRATLASLAHVYCSDQSRITYLISLLTGRALDWATATWGSCFQCSYEDFKTHFKVNVTSKRLLDLRQGDRSVADYAAEFRILVVLSGWDNTTLLACFWRGLNPQLRKELVFRGESWTLNHFIETTKLPPSWEERESVQLGHGRLTVEEQQRRLQSHRCLYCRNPSHLRVDCLVRPEPQWSTGELVSWGLQSCYVGVRSGMGQNDEKLDLGVVEH
ncbi:hypothetical protein Z043_122058, partial [Scleropages formosus]